MERKSSFQPVNVHRRSLSDQSLGILPTTINKPAGPSVYNPAAVSADPEDESDNHYATINDLQQSLVKPHLSKSREAVGEEDEDEGERCHSLDAFNLNNVLDDTIYYNLRRATPPMIKRDLFQPEIDDSECIYSDVKVDSSLNPELQAFSSPLPPTVPQLPPCTIPQSVPYTPTKPRYQRQPPANNYIQPGYNAQAQAVDEVKEMEEANSSSTRVTPSEAPGSFKHRLAEIISKDLAKFQPPLPSGVDSPTFSQ